MGDDGEGAVPQDTQLADYDDRVCADQSCDPRSPAGWDGRTVEAVRVAQDAMASDSPPGRVGSTIRCKRIVGPLDLRWRKLPGPLTLERCLIEGDVLLVDAEAAEIRILDSVVTGLCDATRVDIGGCLIVSGSVLRRGLLLTGARIGGDLRCSTSDLHPAETTGAALDARGARVEGDVHLCPGVRAIGQVNLRSMQVGRDLCCDGSTFRDASHAAFDACGVTVKGGVSLSVAREEDGTAMRDSCGEPLRCRVDGGVELRNATIEGDLECSGARMSGTGHAALNADNLVRVGGNVSLGVALESDGTALQDNQRNPVRFEADGEVRMVIAVVKGQIIGSGGRFHYPGQAALSLDGVTALDLVFDVALDDHEHGIHDAQGAPVRCDVVGEVRLLGVAVAGQVRFNGAHLDNGSAIALHLNGATVGDLVELGDDRGIDGRRVAFEAIGGVSLRNATCGRFRGAGGVYSSPDGTAFDGSQMTVHQGFCWRDVVVQGVVDVRGASVATLEDDAAAWPTANRQCRLAGFRYDGIVAASEGPSSGAEMSLDARKRWLAGQEVYSSQPYRQLAAVYRNRGDDRSARKIAMEQFNAQLRRRDTGLKPQTRFWRSVLRAFIGHGYEPWRALVPAFVVWMVAWLAVNTATNHGAMVRTKSPVSVATGAPGAVQAGGATAATAPKPKDCTQKDYPCLSPITYAAELVFPIVKLDQRDNWRPNGKWYYRAMVPIFVTIGWLLTTMVVAGFSSLVRRD